MPLLAATRELFSLNKRASPRVDRYPPRRGLRGGFARQRTAERGNVSRWCISASEDRLNGANRWTADSHKPTTFANVDTAADDLALIAFTSGTTGEGKGTMHFHRDVLAICDCFPPYVLKATPDDVFIGSPPFAFTFGLGGILLFPMRIGASTVLLEQATPPHLIKGIQDYRATVVFTAPTAYRAMLGMQAAHDLSSLRRCVSAGEALPLATYDAWHAATGLTIIDGIGATELLHIFISASDDEIRPGATGKVVPGSERVWWPTRSDLAARIGRLAVRARLGALSSQRDAARVFRDGGTYGLFVQRTGRLFWYQARR